MGLDIRLPIGMLFSIIGILLSVFGAFSDKALYQRSLGINVNLIWGLVLLAFGAVMLLLGWRGIVAPRSGDRAGADTKPPSEGTHSSHPLH
jgi:membrane protease YdiL (CAAX protease family)